MSNIVKNGINNNLKKYLKDLNTPYKNIRKVSISKSIAAILGSLFITYFGLAIFSKFIFNTPEEALIILLLLNTFLWPCLCIWIFVSKSPKIAFLRTFVPSFIVGIAFIFLIL